MALDSGRRYDIRKSKIELETDQKAETIITCFPQNYDHGRTNQSDVLDEISKSLYSHPLSSIGSVHELAVIITTHCLDCFNSFGSAEIPPVLDLYDNALQIIVCVHVLLHRISAYIPCLSGRKRKTAIRSDLPPYQ